MTELKSVAPDFLPKTGPAEGIVLDVRTPMEYDETHLQMTHAHVPLDRLDPQDFMRSHAMDVDTAVYMLCRSGQRAIQAAEKFIHGGYHNVHIIEGGIIACEKFGHAVAGRSAKSDGKK